jgi:hypothetical protein
LIAQKNNGNERWSRESKVRNKCTMHYDSPSVLYIVNGLYTVYKMDLFLRSMELSLSKKVSDFPVPIRPGRVWLVTSRLGTRKFVYSTPKMRN